MEMRLSRLVKLVIRPPKELERFLKFAVVGTIGAMVDFSILNLLVRGVGVNVYVSNTFSFTAAVLNNYTLNSLWTFGDQEDKEPARQLAQFFIISVGGLLINQALMFLFIENVGLWYNWAKAIATIVVLFWNFAGNRLWTFRG